MQTISLSETAVAVLRFRIKGLRVPATDRRLDAYRELAAAGIMEPLPDAVGNPEADFRFTEDEGHMRKNCSPRCAIGSSASDSIRPMQVTCRNVPQSCFAAASRASEWKWTKRRSWPTASLWRRGSWSRCPASSVAPSQAFGLPIGAGTAATNGLLSHPDCPEQGPRPAADREVGLGGKFHGCIM